MKSKRSNRFRLTTTIVCGLAALPLTASAASLYWDTNTTGNAGSGAAAGTWGSSVYWSTDPTGNNVDPGTLGSVSLTAATTAAADLFFSAGTNGTAGTVAVTGTQLAHSVTFDDPVSLTLSSGTAINIGSAAADSGLFFTANAANTISTAIYFNSAATVANFTNSGTALQTIGGGLTSGATGGATQTVTLGASSTGGMFMNGVIGNGGSGGVLALTVNSIGTGPILLNNTNTFTGGVTLQAGTLVIAQNNSCGTGPLVLTGGTLDNNSTANKALGVSSLTWSGDFGFGGGQAVVSGGQTARNLSLGATAVTLTADRKITVNSNTALAARASNYNMLTMGGTIGGAFRLTKDGLGTLLLNSASNTFSGGVTLNAGALRLAGEGSAITNNKITFNGGVLEFAYAPAATYTLGTASAGQLDLTSGGGFSAAGSGRAVTLAGGALTWGTTANFVGAGNALKFGSLTADNILTLTNAINLGGGARTLDATRGTNTNVSDGVLSGAITNGSLIKTGNGSVTLSNASSTITAATISGGTLGMTPTTFSGANLLLNGGMYRAGADYTAAFGSGNGQLRFAGGTADGGFSSDSTANRIFNIGGAGATLTWNSTPNFLGTGALMLNSSASAYTTVLANGLDFNGADRTIYVEHGSATIAARIDGVISGSGGLLKTGGDISGNGRLFLTGASTYTGPTTIRNGSLHLNSSVLNNIAGPLGNSSSTIYISDASSLSGESVANVGLIGLFAQGISNSQSATTTGDTQAITIERPIDVTGSNPASVMGRFKIALMGNGGAGLDTNRLTLSGGLAVGSRSLELYVERNGQTMDISGPISGTTSGVIYLTGNVGNVSGTDGRPAGTFRLSNPANTYAGSLTLTYGTLILAGDVPAGTGNSPQGTVNLSLGDGNGGNILNNNGRDGVRSVFMETAGTTYARPLTLANFQAFTPAAGAQQTAYGIGGSNLGNGYRLGGVNTTGTITFSSAINPVGVNQSITGLAAGLGGTNALSVVHNIALMAATGGTVDFTGVISGSTPPALGATGTPGASSSAGNLARITINQFRNHPNLDENVDGFADPGVANAAVGTATGGTVVMSASNTYGGSTEILGGTLRLNYAANDTSKLANTAALILSGGTLELAGGSHTEVVGSTTLNGKSTVTQTGGSAKLAMGAITRNAGGYVNFTAANIATTTTLNDASGVLGSWATINNTDLAMVDGSGNIVAATTYTEVFRTNSGSQIINTGASTNVRINEGTGTPGNLTLATDATINTLIQSDVGGTGAAIIDPVGQILRTNSILVSAPSGGLTIGTGTNNGTLTAAVAGGDLALQNFSTSPLKINSVIANNTSTSTLLVGGTGTTLLTGTNTYTGATSIAGGALQIGDGTTDGSIATSAAIIDNGALVYNLIGTQTYGGVISGPGTLTKFGAGGLTLTGANTYLGTTTISGGSLQLGDGGTTGALNTTGALVNNGELILNRSNAVTQGADFASSITGSGALTKNGTGTLTLNGANTYDGVTTIAQGVLAITHGAALGSAVGNTVINSNGKVDATGGQLSISGGITLPENITIQGTGDALPYNRAIASTSGANTLTGTLTLTGTYYYRVGADAGTLNLGLIQRSTAGTGNIYFDPGSTGTVIVNAAIKNNGGDVYFHNAGTVVFAAAGNEVGGLRIENGSTLKAGIAAALPSKLITLGQFLGSTAAGINNDVGTLFIEAGDQTIDVISGSRNAANAAIDASNRRITSSTGGTKTLTIGNANGSSTFDGLIENGNGGGTLALTKTGTGTQTLTSPQTYTGDTTINNGTLALGAVAAVDALGSSQAGTSVNASNTLTVGSTTGLAAGQAVSGPGLTGTVYIVAVPSSTTLTLNASATTASGAGAGSFTFGAFNMPAHAGAISNDGTVRINGSGKLNLASGVTDTVTALYLNGVQQPAGSYTSANPSGAFTGAGTLVVTNGPAGYSSWATANGVTGQIADQDHDSDGVSNGVEYFIGGPSGNTTGFTALPGVTTVAGVRSVTWTKAASYTGSYGTDYFVESSATLAAGSWTTEALGGTVTQAGNNVTYTFPAGPVKTFARLKVTGP